MTIQTALVNRHVQQHTDLTTTAATSVFQVSGNGAYMTALHIVNDDAGASTAVVEHVKDSVSCPLWPSQTIAGGATLTLTFPAPFALRDSEELRVTAGHANRLHVWAFATNQ